MDKLKRLGVLTFIKNEYQCKEYLFVDDKTGKVFVTFDDLQSENFSGLSETNIITNVRDYFEEEMKPVRQLEMPTREGAQELKLYFKSDKLNEMLTLHFHEEFGDFPYHGFSYKSTAELKESDLNG